MSAYLCTIVYCLLHWILFFLYRFRVKKNNITVLILAYFGLSSFFSILYFSASNGIYRDYSNITLSLNRQIINSSQNFLHLIQQCGI